MAKDAVQPVSASAGAGRFNRRTYHGLGEFFADMWFLTKNIRQSIRVMRGKLIAHSFRERLMLAVASVYGCTFCSWLHTREALRRGIDEGEIAILLAGSVDNCPQEEAVAILYAQHWADSDMHPDPEAVEELQRVYGADTAKIIDLVLRMNRVGELSGNTGDFLLYKVSGGRWGGPDSLINTATAFRFSSKVTERLSRPMALRRRER